MFEIRKNRTVAQGRRTLFREREEYYRLRPPTQGARLGSPSRAPAQTLRGLIKPTTCCNCPWNPPSVRGLPRSSSGAAHQVGEPVASGLAGQESVVDEGAPQRDGVQCAALAPWLQAVGHRPLVVDVAERRRCSRRRARGPRDGRRPPAPARRPGCRRGCGRAVAGRAGRPPSPPPHAGRRSPRPRRGRRRPGPACRAPGRAVRCGQAGRWPGRPAVRRAPRRRGSPRRSTRRGRSPRRSGAAPDRPARWRVVRVS